MSITSSLSTHCKTESLFKTSLTSIIMATVLSSCSVSALCKHIFYITFNITDINITVTIAIMRKFLPVMLIGMICNEP